jgi:hypothetical protein
LKFKVRRIRVLVQNAQTSNPDSMRFIYWRAEKYFAHINAIEVTLHSIILKNRSGGV